MANVKIYVLNLSKGQKHLPQLAYFKRKNLKFSRKYAIYSKDTTATLTPDVTFFYDDRYMDENLKILTSKMIKIHSRY